MSTADWLMVGAAIAAGGFIIAHFLRKRPASARKAPSAPPVPLGGSAASGAAYGLQSAAAAQRPAPWPERKSVAQPIRHSYDATPSDNDGGFGIVETVVAASIISDISDSGTDSGTDISDGFSGGGSDFGGGGASGSWE